MQKRFSGGTREWLMLLLGAVVLLAALLLPLGIALADDLTAEEEELWNAYQQGDVIRIHVIANSDSPEDQALKLQVRDALIEAFGVLLAEAGAQSSDTAYHMLRENCETIRLIAQGCAAANGFAGFVQAEAGVLRLPEKHYGNVTLPEGEYRALRITIGDGAGENWWCVLYPQLCLALAGGAAKDDAGPFRFSRQIFSHWLLMAQ